MLVADHGARVVLAGELAAFPIECVSVRIVGRRSKNADVAVFFDPAHLAVVRNIAPNKVTAGSVPGRTLGPTQSSVESLDCGVVRFEFGEARVEDDDVRVGIADRVLVGPVALGRGGWRDGAPRPLAQPASAFHPPSHSNPPS